MKQYIDLFFESVLQHTPCPLPLADRYAATENGRPGDVRMMTAWRTIKNVRFVEHIYTDPMENQVMATAVVDEGGMPSIFVVRLKIEDKKITEIEIFMIRSRSDAGFVFSPEGMEKDYYGWISPIPAGGRASREELNDLGKAVFDSSSEKLYPSSSDCILIESGGVVYESPAYIYALNPDSFKEKPSSMVRMPIPYSMHKDRPDDPDARVVLIDEEQGVVVVIGSVDGYVTPYIVPDETSACFVPKSLIELHNSTLTPEMFRNRKTVKEMPAVGMTVTIIRYHSGQIQGYRQEIVVLPKGSRSPWNRG
jgi:hypothetical protein